VFQGQRTIQKRKKRTLKSKHSPFRSPKPKFWSKTSLKKRRKRNVNSVPKFKFKNKAKNAKKNANTHHYGSPKLSGNVSKKRRKRNVSSVPKSKLQKKIYSPIRNLLKFKTERPFLNKKKNKKKIKKTKKIASHFAPQNGWHKFFTNKIRWRDPCDIDKKQNPIKYTINIIKIVEK
jgi:hypothetical protein